MSVEREGRELCASLSSEPAELPHVPAVDVLFRSTAKVAGSRAIGVLLTGMGRDGAEGMLALKTKGAYTIAQDEKSCAVFGMPKAAVESGGASIELELDMIGPALRSRLAR